MSSWVENKVAAILIYLFHNSICADVKAYCIQFLNLIFQQKLPVR